MRPDAELRLPVDPAFVSVLRAAAVSMAARLNFTVDDIEDLRMAVGEAASLVLPEDPPEGADLHGAFFFDAQAMTVRVSTRTKAPAPVDESDFAWQVLSALTVDSSTEVAADTVMVTFTVRSTASI